jgi:hypothetical protein
MSAHQDRHAQSLDTLIDAIAAANTSLSVAINTHWRALLTAIDHTDAKGLKQAVEKIETVIEKHPDTRSEWWLVEGAVKQGLARLGGNGKHVIFLRG